MIMLSLRDIIDFNFSILLLSLLSLKSLRIINISISIKNNTITVTGINGIVPLERIGNSMKARTKTVNSTGDTRTNGVYFSLTTISFGITKSSSIMEFHIFTP